MSRTKLTEVEKRELMVPCDRCLTAIGIWCSTADGLAWERNLHRERFNAATEAGLLPLNPATEGIVW